jgi:hypothetical protein
MKRLFKVTLFAAGILAVGQGQAQTHTDDHSVGHKIGTTAKDVGHETAKTATKVGHKTAEVSAKGAAAITDKRYDGKMAPGGQTVYINKDSRYFYINKTGHRVYLKKSALRDKPSR